MKKQQVIRDFSNEDKTSDNAKGRLAEDRIIKYNFWQPSTKTMHCWEDFIEYGIFEMFENNDSVPLQFTGIKDGIGKDVYQGNLLLSEMYGIGVVKWDNDNSCFSVFVPSNPKDDQYFFVKSYGKIIGNIYENPDLLVP